VAVKAIDGGRFSRYAQGEIKQGMALEVMVPQGHFGYQPQAQQQWAKENNGDKLTIKQSHAGSSKQALAILQGLKADVVRSRRCLSSRRRAKGSTT
jgi:hypothetical protein